MSTKSPEVVTATANLTTRQRQLLTQLVESAADNPSIWVGCVEGDARTAKTLRDRGLAELSRANPGLNDTFLARLPRSKAAQDILAAYLTKRQRQAAKARSQTQPQPQPEAHSEK
jgi:hypothetical protein